MQGYFSNLWFNIQSILNTFSWKDALDILIVSYFVYSIINLVAHTRTGVLLKGIILLVVAYLFATALGLKTVKYLIGYIFNYGILVAVIVFQPEARNILEKIGRSRFGLTFFNGVKSINSSEAADLENGIATICSAAEIMSKSYTGALIVFERGTPLDDIIGTGTMMNADITEELVGNIFYKGAPLHDGAVVVRGGKITAAGCILPVSHNLEISKEMGTRHRAAIGMSENSDAVVLVVSEENGYISIAQDGAIKRHLSKAGAQKILLSQLMPKEEKKSERGFFGRLSR